MVSHPPTGLFMRRSRVSSGIVMLTQLWSVWFLILQQAYSLAEAGSQEQEKHEKPLGAKALTCTRVILAYSSGKASQRPAQSWGKDSTFSWEGVTTSYYKGYGKGMVTSVIYIEKAFILLPTSPHNQNWILLTFYPSPPPPIFRMHGAACRSLVSRPRIKHTPSKM